MTDDNVILAGGGVLTLDNNNTPSGSYYKVDVIASLFGVTVRRVQQLTQEGIIQTVQTSEGRRYDLGPTVQKYISFLSDKAYGRDKDKKESELKEQKLKAEIALKESQGELHQLKTSIAAGKYISVEEVQADYNKFFIVFKKFALSIPSRVAGMISSVVEPVTARAMEKDLTREVTSMLNAFVVAGNTEAAVTEVMVNAEEEKETTGEAETVHV